MRRVALLLAGAMVLSTVAFAGPASAAKVTSCSKDKKLNVNIQKAFIPFFVGTTATEKVANVQDGDKITTVVEESTQAARSGGQTASGTVTVPVEVKATCDGKKAAIFTYDLALNQPAGTENNPPATGAGLNFAGDAVLQKGKWVIAALTICDLIGQNPNTPTIGQRCQDAAL
ncbi:MAG: hypothetical protein ACKOA9_09815 [Actinomycetota bacterium]